MAPLVTAELADELASRWGGYGPVRASPMASLDG